MSDFRLKFAKGTQRLVVVDEFNNKDILIPAGPPFLLFLSIFVVIKGIDFASSPMFFNSTRFPFFFSFSFLNLFTLPWQCDFFFYFLINKYLSKSNAPVMKLGDISG